MGPTLHSIPGRLWVVQLAEELSRRLVQIAAAWPPAEKQSLGDQLLRAVDSVGANLSEGYARAHSKERLHFFSIAQGSLEEALFWLRRARDRGLASRKETAVLSTLFVKLSHGIANFMASQRQNGGELGKTAGFP